MSNTEVKKAATRRATKVEEKDKDVSIDVVESQDLSAESEDAGMQSPRDNSILEMLKALSDKIEKLEKENDRLSQPKDFDSKKDSREHVVRCMFTGSEWIVRLDAATTFSMKYGDTYEGTLKELRSLLMLNRYAFENGYLVLDDREIAEELRLGKFYDSFINEKTLDTIWNLNIDDLREVYEGANNAYREMIVNKFVSEYIEGKNHKFRDMSKILMLGELSGQDLQTIIRESMR